MRATLIRKSFLERQVEGLRDTVMGSDVKVYKANSDWTKGEYVGIEPATEYSPNFTRTSMKDNAR
jgi:hypothetical protein